MLVYLALLSIIFAMAYDGYGRFQRHSVALQRNVYDMERTLLAGERWRADLRQAAAAPRLVETASRTELHIPRKSGGIVYFFENGTVWRRREKSVSASPLLRSVRESRMIADRGASVTSWRWEVELRSDPKATRIRPLFTFQTVPTTQR
jgi:type II secretory pathway component PulJ